MLDVDDIKTKNEEVKILFSRCSIICLQRITLCFKKPQNWRFFGGHWRRICHNIGSQYIFVPFLISWWLFNNSHFKNMAGVIFKGVNSVKVHLFLVNHHINNHSCACTLNFLFFEIVSLIWQNWNIFPDLTLHPCYWALLGRKHLKFMTTNLRYALIPSVHHGTLH